MVCTVAYGAFVKFGKYALDLVVLELVAAERFAVAVAVIVCGILYLCKVIETVCCGVEFAHYAMEYGVSVLGMIRVR